MSPVDRKLSAGQTYQVIAKSYKKEEYWYFLVKTDRGDIFALKAKDDPPANGFVNTDLQLIALPEKQ